MDVKITDLDLFDRATGLDIAGKVASSDDKIKVTALDIAAKSLTLTLMPRSFFIDININDSYRSISVLD